MSRLRDKLLRMKSHTAAQEQEEGKAEAANTGDAQQEELSADWKRMDVREERTAEGSFLLRERRYPLSYRHGEHQLDELASTAAGLIAFQAQKEGASAVNPIHDRILFFDLETTGLGIGAGNVPFMVGLGFCSGEQFVVEQMLIRHPAEERAMLAYLMDKLPNFTHLATYNGKTFDWPVLMNRFILHGFRQFAWQPVHLDLLHPSRSIWRNTLASCKLSHIEEERLGIARVDDVPGMLAPSIYFQFLADQEPAPLLGVFRHNEIDMISLACLAIRFAHLLAGQLGERLPYPDGAEELIRTGMWLEKMQGAPAAEPLYARLQEWSSPAPQAWLMLAARDKKYGNWPRAVLLWQKVVQAADGAEWHSWEAHIELSMYYEHKTKQFEPALALAETALSLARRRYTGLVRPGAKQRAELEGIRKRIERLRLKVRRISDEYAEARRIVD
ncbi:ribonuclease H-like domain-containing protein [Paenibacillus sp. GCM10027626]|uniref:ribonuclease H-like domain-containing protein n=1 Tax=Paenibacillus sp. GCM10027626 TaxID=3273411 RepID=UPI003632723B